MLVFGAFHLYFDKNKVQFQCYCYLNSTKYVINIQKPIEGLRSIPVVIQPTIKCSTGLLKRELCHDSSMWYINNLGVLLGSHFHNFKSVVGLGPPAHITHPSESSRKKHSLGLFTILVDAALSPLPGLRSKHLIIYNELQ